MNLLNTTLTIFLIVFCIFSTVSCKEKEENSNMTVENVILKRFNGNYNKTFNDLQDAHMSAAMKKGISPLVSRADTINHMDELTRLPMELEVYKIDELKHSVPYLTHDAKDLLIDICINFRDSLVRKKIPLHKLIITSVTRTDEDVSKLKRRNGNASENSVHRYATTFDISWRRFQKINPYQEEYNIEKLKKVLGEVLYDLRQQNKCYIKHERKQACFHITVQ